MSEVVSPSDKAGHKKQGRVRSCVTFGQGRVKKARSCPKLCHLRTRQDQKGKVMSEAVSPSDKAGSKKQGRVRSCVTFGQGRVKKARSCPKLCHLRTRQDQKGKVMSEAVSPSDKARPKKQGHVRSRVTFGQGRAKKARSCPKSSNL